MGRYSAAVLVLVLGVSGCSIKVPPVVYVPHEEMQAFVTLYRHPLEIRLSKPRTDAEQDYLVIYSTGDGGWYGLSGEVYDWIAGWGYPVAGFSSKNYLKNLGYVSDKTTPARLVQDFERVIAVAEEKLGLASHPRIILVGVSRGAGLSVVAAGQKEFQSRLAGVVAIALTKEEEHVVHARHPRGQGSHESPNREVVEIQTYEYLPLIAGAPVAVIQSTHDSYLPAEAARSLFGPDTDLRKLSAVEARNHRFGGGREALYKDVEGALHWVIRLGAGHPSALNR